MGWQRKRWLVLALFCSLGSGVSLFGQTQEPESAAEPGGLDDPAVQAALERAFGKEWGVQAEVQGTYRSSVDLDSSSASLSEFGEEVQITIGGPVGRLGRLDFELRHGLTWYDWDDAQTLQGLGREPYDFVQKVGLRTTLLHAIARDWAALASYDFTLAAAEGADLTEGFSWNALAGAGTRLGDDLLIGGGIFISQRLERDIFVVPGVFVDWTIDEEWRLRFFGPGLELTYSPSKEWTFGFNARYDSERFRLDQSSPVRSGVVEDVRFPITLEVTWKPDDTWTLSLAAGVDAFREIRIRDENGNNPREFETDLGAVLSAAIEVRF